MSGVGEAINSRVAVELSGPCEYEYEYPWTNGAVEKEKRDEGLDRFNGDKRPRRFSFFDTARFDLSLALHETVTRRPMQFTPAGIHFRCESFRFTSDTGAGFKMFSMIERKLQRRVRRIGDDVRKRTSHPTIDLRPWVTEIRDYFNGEAIDVNDEYRSTTGSFECILCSIFIRISKRRQACFRLKTRARNTCSSFVLDKDKLSGVWEEGRAERGFQKFLSR